MSLRPGDIVTEEPTGPGTVIETPSGNQWTLGADGLWRGERTAQKWYRLEAKYEGVTLRLTCTPGVEPAEEWELVTADQVRLGDHIEVVTSLPKDASCTIRGIVEQFDGPVAGISGFLTQLRDIAAATVTIRRRVRAPMPEPDAPAVVRHAGRMFARGEHDSFTGLPWLLVSGDVYPDGTFAGTWPEVLALDPSTDPVPVDLGGGA